MITLDSAHADFGERIQEAEHFSQDLSGASDRIQIWRVREVPRHSCYRIDNTPIMTLDSHRKDRPTIPAITCKKGGTLFKIITEEFDTLTQNQV